MAKATYWTYAQMVEDCKILLSQLPSDICGVVGVPRSGLVCAGVLAQLAHLPLYTITKKGIFEVGHGGRMRERFRGRFLLVDDVISSGKTISIVSRNWPKFSAAPFIVGTPYVTTRSYQQCGYYSRVLEYPYYFEWNLLNFSRSANLMVDFDGVLCHDPSGAVGAGEDDDPDAYREFILTAQPRLYARKAPMNIVTYRCEKWRKDSLTWLVQHRMAVEKLTMFPANSRAERNAAIRRHWGTWKGEIYRDTPNMELFIESNLQQAAEIFRVSGRPVISVEQNTLFA